MSIQKSRSADPDALEAIRASQAARPLHARYDYVVVGTGSAGCALVGRLSENPDVSILVLEAGGWDTADSVDDPGQWFTNLGTDRDWADVAIPSAGVNHRAIPEHMGQNPFPTLRALREQDPVHRNPDGSVYLTRHADLLKVYQSRAMLSDKKVAFGKKFGQCPLFKHHTTSLLFSDPPYHTVVRKLLAFGFTPKKLTEMEPLIGEIVDRLLDGLEGVNEFDLIPAFAMALPTEIISFMLGVPEEHRHKLRGYSLAILGALDPVVPPERLEAGNRAVEEFGAMLGDIIEHRRRHPGAAGPGEVIDALAFGEVDGRRLTEEELIQNCIFLLNAGHETTTSLVGNAVGVLLDHPDQHRRLIEDPSLIETAIEEVLRFQSPLQIGNRLAGEPIELAGGEVLEAGTYIHTSIAAANRDPAVFDRPEEVDIGRQKNKHLAFATGIHVCLGAALARLEGRIAIGKLVRRFPTLSANGRREMVPLARFRGYRSFPVRV